MAHDEKGVRQLLAGRSSLSRSPQADRRMADPDVVSTELLRGASQKVFVVPPKQRPYFYALDEHASLFCAREQLLRLVPDGLSGEAEESGCGRYMEIRK